MILQPGQSMNDLVFYNSDNSNLYNTYIPYPGMAVSSLTNTPNAVVKS